MVPLGRVENWPFLRLFEHGVRNWCICERLRMLLYSIFRFCCFALSSSVFLASICEKMLGQVKNIDFGVCKLLTQSCT